MKIAGETVLNAPVDRVWDAVLDPRVLVATIPGCEQLEETAPHHYDMTVSAGVASIKGTYAGTCRLSDLHQHESLLLAVQGAGAAGTIGADVEVRLTDLGDGTTGLKYDADAVVGGMIGGVGQRMLTSVSKRMAAEFFNNVERAINHGVPTPTAAEGAGDAAGEAAATLFRPPAPSSAAGGRDFWSGVAVGAGLVLLGVAAGAVLGRGRR